MSELDTIAEQSAVNNQANREAREKARQASEEQFAKDRAEMEKRNLEKMEADAKLRPTPTPEEIHMAMAGHNKAIKEPDGAPLQNERHPIASPARQIEVGRETPTAQPVGSSSDQVNQSSQNFGKPHTDRSDVSSERASESKAAKSK